MSSLPIPADPATYPAGALAILAAAERLFGQHGIEGVSMRQITLAAKMANNSAIAYHFGDRDGLLYAISRWRAGQIEQERKRLFDLAEAAGAAHNPAQIVQIIMRPVLSVRADDGSHTHAAFVSEMLRSRLGREIRYSVYGQTRVISEMVDRLHRHAPDLSRVLFEFRLRTGCLAFYDAIVERDQMAPDDPARLTIDDEGFLAELDAIMLAIVLRKPC